MKRRIALFLFLALTLASTLTAQTFTTIFVFNQFHSHKRYQSAA